ncbi:MAG: protein translocase subunit SecD [bacterium]
MDKKTIFKWMLLVILVGLSVATVFPVSEKVRFGLDIKGGTSFTVQIDEEAMGGQIREEIKLKLGEEEFAKLSEEDVKTRVKDRLANTIKEAQARALEVIRNRVDGLGIAEPIIFPEKDNRIVVQLPGVDEKKRDEAARSIQSAAFLEFRMVHEKNSELISKFFERGVAPEGYKIVSLSDGGAAKDYVIRDKKAVADVKMDSAFRKRVAQFNAPARCEFLLERQKVGGREAFTPYYVEKRTQLTGDTLKRASVDYRSLGQAVVNLEFNPKGAHKFAVVTGDYAPGGAKNSGPVGRQMAIVLDGTLYSAPVIREAIHGGRAEISGNFTPSEAIFLSNILKAGSLPAPVEIVERRVVDPTLGRDSVTSGVNAGVYGCVVIILLMALYYLLNGLLADLALILNVVLLPLGMLVVAGVLGMFSSDARAGSAIALPVLTLPGIAGIALSIGMAVDTNVLIFERIREELKGGKSLKASIDAGFSRAFAAVFDSHVATILTAVIMFIFGSGPVRGYAITLIAGLLINLYTAVTVTHMCHTLIATWTNKVSILKMFSIIPETNIDFIGKWKWFLSGTFLVVVISWGIMFAHGAKDRSSVFGVDFTGGTQLTMSFESKPEIETVRSVLTKGGVKDPSIQFQKGMESNTRDVLLVKVATLEEGRLVENLLTNQIAQAGFKVMQQDDVGPQIGKELKVRASWAMILGTLAMVIYIAFRFEFGFGLGAVVATIHDAMITIGVCHLLGFPITMTLIAGVLTIIGYSSNDTVIIFDRIRENLRLYSGHQTFKDLCNHSINQTLARTLLTSSFTMVSVLFLVWMGGGALKDFSVAMLVGMITGTYSSIYIATPVTLAWYRWKAPDLGQK